LLLSETGTQPGWSLKSVRGLGGKASKLTALSASNEEPVKCQ